MGGAQNIEPIDLLRGGNAHGTIHVRTFQQGGKQGLPFGGGELLGIVQAGKAFQMLRQNHGTGHHGTGQRAASGLIHPSHVQEAGSPRLRFKTHVRV